MRLAVTVAAMVSVVALALGSVCANVLNMPTGQTNEDDAVWFRVADS